MQRIPFTNPVLAALPRPAKGTRTEYRDDMQPSLLLRVTADGARTFAVVGWSKAKRNMTRVTLGAFMKAGDPSRHMGVEQARKKAAAVLAALASGADPNADKREAQADGMTLQAMLAAYLKANTRLKPRTREDYADVLREFCADWLKKPLATITRDAIQRRHAKHGADRSKARADNAVRVLRALFNYAGIAPNPASSPKKRRAGQPGSFLFDVPRKRTRLKDHQLPTWWEAVTGLQGHRSDSGADTASDLLQFLLLTGLRAGEACSLSWAYVDVRDGVIEVPDTKNREPHLLPLSKRLAEIIARRAEAKAGPYVFAAKSDLKAPYPYGTLRGWFQTVADECGVRITAHDLRRTFASIAEELDISASTVKRLLNHRTGRSDVTEGYVIPSAARLRGAMQRIEDRILEIAKDSTLPTERQRTSA